MSDSVKVHFELEQDQDGYPPVAVESVWAQPGANHGEYVIDNLPFFARDATIGDTVVVRDENGRYWFERVVHPSQSSLVRVVFFDRSCVERISERLTMLGCSVEYLQDYNLLAVSVPGKIKLADVQEYLRAEVSRGSIDYEEPIIRH